MQVVLRLRDVRELFEEPERSPLDDDYEPWCTAPAAEYLAQVLRGDPKARITLEIPGTVAGPDEIRAALTRWARGQAAGLDREIRGEARHGLWALVPTGIVFALTLALSKYTDSSGSHWVSNTISEALVVIGWVVLWSPVAVFGTDIWVLRSRRRTYLRLASAEIEVH